MPSLSRYCAVVALVSAFAVPALVAAAPPPSPPAGLAAVAACDASSTLMEATWVSAATAYHIGWRQLAAVTQSGSDYGCDMASQSGDSGGWVRLPAATWNRYAVASPHTGSPDPANSADAEFTLARALSATGARDPSQFDRALVRLGFAGPRRQITLDALQQWRVVTAKQMQQVQALAQARLAAQSSVQELSSQIAEQPSLRKAASVDLARADVEAAALEPDQVTAELQQNEAELALNTATQRYVDVAQGVAAAAGGAGAPDQQLLRIVAAQPNAADAVTVYDSARDLMGSQSSLLTRVQAAAATAGQRDQQAEGLETRAQSVAQQRAHDLVVQQRIAKWQTSDFASLRRYQKTLAKTASSFAARFGDLSQAEDGLSVQERIVQVAQGELNAGISEANRKCMKYGPCLSEPWCALFLSWVWQQAGIDMPTFAFSGDIYTWAQEHTVVYPPTVTPQPGWAALEGTGPATTATSIHVALVEQVFPDGEITLINGNWGNAVARSGLCNPTDETDFATNCGGGPDHTLYGYAAPLVPAAGTAPPQASGPSPNVAIPGQAVGAAAG